MSYYKESGDPKDKPPQALKEKVERGELGIKTQKGFYEY
jgi:3-hydroxybutyryl-CoA dehydrogenase